VMSGVLVKANNLQAGELVAEVRRGGTLGGTNNKDLVRGSESEVGQACDRNHDEQVRPPVECPPED
jgi:hypothetical protein